jgi:hypothetical protein
MIEKNILKKLNSEGYECFYNVSLGEKIAELVAIKNNKITAFEFKKHALEIPMAIGQCLHYLNDVNEVYIVLCSIEKDLIPQSTTDILKEHGIGLMISDHIIEVLIKAKQFDKNNNLIIKKIREKEFTRNICDRKHIRECIINILKEHSDGLNILNIAKLSGMNRLTISKYLAILEAEKAVELRKIGMAKIFKLKSESK